MLRSESPILTAFQRTQIAFLIILFFGLGFAIFGTFYVSKKITTPIGRLTIATRKFSRGDLDSTIEITSRDEIGQLAADFNKMSKDLKKMIHEVDIHKKLAAVGKFAASMYHDIKSLLEGIKFLVAGLKRKTPENAPIKKYVDEIAIGVNNLDQLIYETLDFVKPKSLNLQPINVNELLRSVILELRLKNVEIKWSTFNNLPELELDPLQMKHAIVNVVNNSIEAMPNGGILRISTASNKDQVIIEISDTGFGIERDNLENIFQPFYTTKVRGHGLGLSIVHQIVKNHDGHISIDSEVGKGTTVIVRLPILVKT